jgi:hypothetical protein
VNSTIAVSFSAQALAAFNVVLRNALHFCHASEAKLAGPSKPVIFSLQQTVIALGTEFLILLSSNASNGFTQVFGDVEFVEHNSAVGFVQVRFGRSYLGIPHVR